MESIHIKKKGSEVMNLRLLTIGFSALVLAVFSTGCGIFESAGKSPENSFYRPKPGKNLPVSAPRYAHALIVNNGKCVRINLN